MAVAFSPDGKTVLTGSDDGTARLWSAADGTPIGQPLKHQGAVVAVAFSPDGKTILTGGADGTARLWSAADGTPIGRPLKHQGAVKAVAFSPDGKAVLTGGDDGTARLWDAADGTPIGQPLRHQRARRAVAFSPDGKTVLTGSDDGTARLWNAADGTPIGRPLRHRGPVMAVAFSPDGKAVLTGSDDGTARLWNAADGTPIGRPLKHPGLVRAVAFSPDGKAVPHGKQRRHGSALARTSTNPRRGPTDRALGPGHHGHGAGRTRRDPRPRSPYLARAPTASARAGRPPNALARVAMRLLQNLVSAGPWPSAASPRASSALRIQRRRTNRGGSPGYGICKQWLNRRPRRPGESPQTQQRQGIRSGRGRARCVTKAMGPTAEPSQTSRDRPPVQGILGHLRRWSRRSRTSHEAAAR